MKFSKVRRLTLQLDCANISVSLESANHSCSHGTGIFFFDRELADTNKSFICAQNEEGE